MDGDPFPELTFDSELPAQADIAIVGGGFSGLTAAARLATLKPRSTIVVFERRPRNGPGVAYGACAPGHLLNVPAGRMGAFPEETVGFLDWLGQKFPGRYGGNDFVPRSLFGQYVTETVRKVLARSGASVRFVSDAVVHIEPLGPSFELLLASGRSLMAHGAILAPGIPQVRAPWRLVDSGVPRRFVAHDPWDPSATEDLDPEASVLIVGSGLTALDVVVGLRQRGHRGKITLVSRGGRFPLPHAATPTEPVSYDPEVLARGVDSALSEVRRAVKRLHRDGKAWQPAIDGVRPWVAQSWRAWSDVDRACFLNRLRPFWEIHRHRAPAEVLETVVAEQAAGTIELVSGTLQSMRVGGLESVDIVVVPASGPARKLSVARVINCAGPAMSVGDTLDPLLGALLRLGMACVDSRGLGLRTDHDGRLMSPLGWVHPRFYLVGALRRGELWESTAVPELRQQVATVAAALAKELP